jgi:integrase
LRVVNGRFQVRFKVVGRARFERLTDLEATPQNRTKAERLERKWRDEVSAGLRHPQTIGSGLLFQKASVQFRAYCRSTHADHLNTAKRVETSLTSLDLFFAGKSIKAIRPADIEAYKSWRLDEHKVKPITLRHDLDNLSKFFRWAMTMDLIDTNPASEIEKPSSEGAIRLYILTAEEEARYMEAAQARSQSLADIFQLILLQGMRPDEVISLMKSDVSIAKQSIQITSGKTLSARRSLLMRSASAAIITRRLAEKDDSLYLFPALRQGKLGSGHISLSGLENCHNDVLESLRTDEASPIDIPCVIYDARHTFATRAAEKGMPLGTLAAILGHSGLRAVMKYVHPTQSHQFEEMKKLDA